VAQPPFVPSGTNEIPSYSSPPRLRGSWTADRPGENVGRPSVAEAGFGNQGPDQGYLLKLAGLLHGEIVLQDGEHESDVVAGCAAVGMKRASGFGRGPVVNDLRAALQIWGFLTDEPPAELVAARKAMFAEVAHAHHYSERLAIADAVPASVLHQPHDAIASAWHADWRSMVDLPTVS
jgi:hypothetical protein